MRPRLELQLAVDVASFDAGDDFFKTTVFSGALVHHFHPPAFALGEFGVHAEQVARKNRRLITACTRANF